MKIGKHLLTIHAIRLIALVALITAAGSLTPARAQTNVGDSLALVEFYNHTNGSSWASSANWLTAPVSTWEGITVSENRVTGIYLPFNNLSGSIPYHLGFLQKLTFLGLPGNTINGSIPFALVFLQQLETLDLSENQLTGTIPSTVGFLLKLKTLNLAKNQLSGSIPDALGLLGKLTFLDLSDNALTGNIPFALGLLSKLETLYLFDNQLKGTIPNSIGGLKVAREIYVYNNQLKGSLPASIGALDSLVFFNAANNQLTGSVPATVADLPKLYLFNVSGNDISGLPNLSGMSSLFQLRVADNKLTFEDLEPNITKLTSRSFFVPQDSVGDVQSVTLCAGDSLKLSADFAGGSANNRYQWFAPDIAYTSLLTADPELVIAGVQPQQSGTYYTRITNTVVRGLTIIRKAVHVTVNTCETSSAAPEQMTVYPVPFTNETSVQVNTASEEDLSLVIQRDNGNVVQSMSGLKTNAAITIGSNLNAGLYYIKATHGGKVETMRVIKK